MDKSLNYSIDEIIEQELQNKGGDGSDYTTSLFRNGGGQN